MLPNLVPFFKPPYDTYAQGVDLTPLRSTATFSELLESPHFIDHITRFSLERGVTKSRAQASVWHMYYTFNIFPSIIVSHSLLLTPLPLKLCELSYNPEQLSILLPHQGKALKNSDTETRYHDLLFNHLSPLHDLLHQAFGVKERTLWSNCFYRLNDFFDIIMGLVGTHPTLLEDKQILTTSAHLGALKNPLKFAEITAHDPSGKYQIRPECCLLHDRENGNYCRDCPKHKHNMVQRKAALSNLSKLRKNVSIE